MATSIKQPSPIPARASARYQARTTTPVHTETLSQPLPQPVQHHSWYRPLGCGASLVLFIFLVWTCVVLPLVSYTVTQWHYGDAHITRITTDIGRGQEDFIAYDNSGQVTVIEVNKSHPDKTHIYIGAMLLHDNGTTIITLGVSDVLHNGRLDIIVTVEGVRYVLFNTGSSLSWSEK